MTELRINGRVMIESQSDLFRGMIIEKPLPATVVFYDDQDKAIYKCPNCGNCANEDACDVIGAEPGCLFCNQCHHEFDAEYADEIAGEISEAMAGESVQP